MWCAPNRGVPWDYGMGGPEMESPSFVVLKQAIRKNQRIFAENSLYTPEIRSVHSQKSESYE